MAAVLTIAGGIFVMAILGRLKATEEPLAVIGTLTTGPTKGSTVIQRIDQSTPLLQIRIIDYAEPPARGNFSATTFSVLEVKMTSAQNWTRIASKRSELFKSKEKQILIFGPSKVGIFGFNDYIVTVDGGRSWKSWYPDYGWKSPEDPVLQEYGIEKNGQIFAEYYNYKTRRYKFISRDYGLTWILQTKK
ncbi:hypothetical protein [Calidithermus terrae]|uniref:hypothetical protein n=1 Tax=Calidithermus terrae TaxID=1408545 RepID=UPI0011C454F1|nr:hypothetical protein [Calidithermus terrae]